MALNTNTIKSQISELISSSENPDITVLQGKQEFINGLADIIINAIKSARITIPPSAIVTVGSQTTQSNTSAVIVENGLT